MDDAYFERLRRYSKQRDAPYVASYRIWSGYELPWKAKNVDAPRVLVMVPPNERSTAQPPRDFYIYFLQPYDEPTFADQELPDGDGFRAALDPRRGVHDRVTPVRWGGALPQAARLSSTGSSTSRSAASVAGEFVWLRQNMANAMTVTYRGEAETRWAPGSNRFPAGRHP